MSIAKVKDEFLASYENLAQN